MSTPAAFFRPAGSKQDENMLFDDPVFTGYIPTNPAPRFTMTKSILDMSAAEKKQKLLEFAREQKDAMDAEARNILSGKYTTDSMHARLLVALHRGDEYFAEQLIIRDRQDTVTKGQRLLTLTNNGTENLRQLLCVLLSMHSSVKRSLIEGNFANLVLDRTRIQSNTSLSVRLPVNPTASSTNIAAVDREPMEYVTWLTDRDGRHPTMAQMREIIQKATNYVRDLHDPINHVAAPRDQPHRRARAREADMLPIFEIETQRVSRSGAPSTSALTLQSYRTSRAAGIQYFPALYCQSLGELQAIRNVIARTEQWLAKLVNEGWSPNSQDPLPFTLTSAGWTATPAARKYQYASHNSVGRNITIWGAIGGSLGFHQQWIPVFTPWDQRLAAIGEHVITVLSSSYINMSGVNSVAAGHNNHTKTSVPMTTYEFYESKLRRDRTYHNNITLLRLRVQRMNNNLNALPNTLSLMQSIEKKKVELESIEQKVTELNEKDMQLEKDLAESWRDRVNSSADFLLHHQAKLNMLKGFQELEDEIRWLLSQSDSPELVAISRSRGRVVVESDED